MVALSGDELEGFRLLCELDPVFGLRFDDGRAIPVTVHLAADAGHFTMTEFTGPCATP